MQIYPCHSQWFIYVPTGLILKNSTFRPHSVFCVVYGSQEKKGEYFSILIGFLPGTECVHCAVRAESLYIIRVNASLQSVKDVKMKTKLCS